jgi:putative transposase
MQLVEQHHIKKSNPMYNELMQVSHLSKNLYNAALYAVRQHFFLTNKFLSYAELANQFTKQRNPDFYALPTKVSQQTLKMAEQNFKSFFGALKSKKSGTNDRKVKIPNYLDKDGYFIVTYTNQAISSKLIRSGVVKLSGCNVSIKTNQKNVQQVRVIPKGNHITIEVIYNVDDVAEKENNNRFASIDLGLSNLATVASNCCEPFIINGKPLKSINQFFNKKKATLQSKLKDGQKTSKRIKSITSIRNNKIKDYLHKASRILVNQLVSNEINTLVIGKNKEWKQEINIGSVNNQKFVSIPHSTFVNMIKYKCKLIGIKVIETEESYTSKCSFLDNEPVKKQSVYLGKRVKRGIFKSSIGKLINADLNGALNILKKVVGEFQYSIEACSTPSVITVKQN